MASIPLLSFLRNIFIQNYSLKFINFELGKFRICSLQCLVLEMKMLDLEELPQHYRESLFFFLENYG